MKPHQFAIITCITVSAFAQTPSTQKAEPPVAPTAQPNSVGPIYIEQPKAPISHIGSIEEQTKAIVFPRVRFKDVTVEQLLNAISVAAGIKITYTPPPQGAVSNITYGPYKDISLSDILKDIARVCKVAISYEVNGVNIAPK